VTRITVRLTPRAGRDAVDGWRPDPRGGEQLLHVRVGAPPADGRANDALVRVLAGALGIAPGRVTLVSGAASRRKVVEIDLEADEIARRLGPV